MVSRSTRRCGPRASAASVVIDGRPALHDRLAIGESGPAGVSYAVVSDGATYRAQKLLVRLDARVGARLEIHAAVTPMPATQLLRAEILVS